MYKRQKRHQELTFYGRELTSLTPTLQGPTYVYDWEQADLRAQDFLLQSNAAGAMNPLVCYALKANAHPKLLQRFVNSGLGFDVVSGGELTLALMAGCDPQKIVFSGVGKTPEEIHQALSTGTKGIFAFNVESASEAQAIIRIAQSLNRPARLSLRLNPQVMARTHKNIATGHGTHKFGITEAEALKLCKLLAKTRGVEIVGLSMHIGSQLRDLKATGQALKQLSQLVKKSKLQFEFLDVGGGLGIPYHHHPSAPKFPSFEKYHRYVMDILSQQFLKQYPFKRMVYEPGRCLVAPCGILLAQVLYLKKSNKTTFAILNAGMTDLIRPGLYDAYHEIYPIIKRPGRKIAYDIVGPVCESSDVLAKNRLMPPLQEGDWVVIADAGAYGFSMSSTYNQRPLPKELVLN
jgi:diaminopimelate decarboxylase